MGNLPFDSLRLNDSDFDLSEGLGEDTDNPVLARLIREEIRASGRMTFRRFMELALYHPAHGYYTAARQRIGRDGDYVTSSEVSPLFAYAVARQIAECWRCLGRPDPFVILEAGAGNGRLARDILRWTAEREPAFHEALQYRTIERSPHLRQAERETLEDWTSSGKLSVLENLDAIEHEGLTGCVLANELLDSFPVHRVVTRSGWLREIYVGLDGGALVDEEGDLSSPALAAYFERLGLLPGEGCIAEVNLLAPEWLLRAAALLRRGYLLLLDYGYPAERLYAPWRRNGTLLCFHRHDVGEDPYRYLGRQDITTHVDFTTLLQTAADLGLDIAGFTSQRQFLANLGLGSAVRLPAAGEGGLTEYYARRRAVEALIDESGLGRISVLLLAKNVPGCATLGFGSVGCAADQPGQG